MALLFLALVVDSSFGLLKTPWFIENRVLGCWSLLGSWGLDLVLPCGLSLGLNLPDGWSFSRRTQKDLEIWVESFSEWYLTLEE